MARYRYSKYYETHKSGSGKFCRLSVLLCTILVLLCGCNQKELVYPSSTMIKVTVKFDWSDALEANPDGMTVVFFPEGAEGSIWRYELSGREGGDIEIPAGRYRMMAFNSDTQYIMYSGTSHMWSYKAYTDKSVPVAWPDTVVASYPELLSYTGYKSPDMLYCGIDEDISVELCSVSYRPCRSGGGLSEAEVKECGHHVLKCFPGSRTSSYTCVLRDVVNIEGMRRGYFVLSGLSPSELIAHDVLSESEGEYMFLASRGEKDVSGKTVAFGSSAAVSVKQNLYFIAVLADGRVVPYCYDVSDQIVNSPDKRNVLIVIDGVELPYVKPGNPDTDFDVEVDDWETVIIDHVVTLK